LFVIFNQIKSFNEISSAETQNKLQERLFFDVIHFILFFREKMKWLHVAVQDHLSICESLDK